MPCEAGIWGSLPGIQMAVDSFSHDTLAMPPGMAADSKSSSLAQVAFFLYLSLPTKLLPSVPQLLHYSTLFFDN